MMALGIRINGTVLQPLPLTVFLLHVTTLANSGTENRHRVTQLEERLSRVYVMARDVRVRVINVAECFGKA